MWTDASGKGFGALLEQEGEDKKRYLIAYASRQTNPAEAKYAPTELEVAALVYAVEHFEVYLLGNNFTVYTDHKALVSAFISHMGSQTKGLLAHWYLRISRFLPKMCLEYKPGSANTVADSLSRTPVEISGTTTVLQVTKESPCFKIQEQQRQDKELNDLINYLCDKSLPNDGQTARNVVSMSMKGFVIDNGILYYEGGDTSEKRRLVVPKHLQSQVLDEQHDGIFAGHFGYKRMYSRLKPYYHWRGMSSDILKKCESCVDCASVQGQGFKGKPPLVNIPVGGSFECIGMDFVELDQSADGNRYALVLQDYLTKWPEVYAVANRKAETVAAYLVDLIWRHGVPSRIIHDRAAEFLSEVIQETARLMGMTQLPTSGGHPQTNGLVERFNRTLKQMLSKQVNKNGRNWDKMLGGVLFAYRSTPHQSTGMSPFYLLYGHDPKLPSALNFQAPVCKFPTIESEYGQELVKELKHVRNMAKQNVQKKQKEQKRLYDRQSKEIDLKVGNLVMLKTQPRFRLDRKYKGPFIVKSVTPTNVVIQLKDDSTAEELYMSRQRVSLCSSGMSHSTP